MPCRIAFTLLTLIATFATAFSQEPQRATIRVEVRTETAPIAGAAVSLRGVSIQSQPNGFAITSLPLAKVDITVSKDGFLPAKATLQIDEAREWQIAFD